MSRNAHDDHVRFKQVVGRYSRRLVRFFPGLAKRDWIVKCWRSFDEFSRKFPHPEQRDAMLEDITKKDAEIREALGLRQEIMH